MKRIGLLAAIAAAVFLPAPLFAGGAPEEDVDRLELAFPAPPVETNRPWAGGWVIYSQFEPMLETLIGTDPATGEPRPRLAREWEVSDDFTRWTFYLEEGVPFHFDYGELTAHDVKHTYELISRPDTQVNMAATWRDRVTDVEIVDDYTITFHFDSPFIDGERLFSRAGGELYVMSKAHWDEHGVAGLDEKIVGTGAYRYVERAEGEHMLVEAVEDHWRDDPDFAEIMFNWVPDDTTRLAMLISGEAHAAELSRDVAQSAETQGMVTIPSTQEAMQRKLLFGGLYFQEGGEAQYDPDNPLIHREVRKALIRAVDIEEIHEVIYHGRVSPTYRTGFVPYQEGWNPEWEERYDDLHSYDPDRARELLAEAGYEEGEAEVEIGLHSPPGQPEAETVLEAIASYWSEVGVDVDIRPVEFGTWLEPWFSGEIHGQVFITRNLPIRTTQEYLEAWHTDAGQLRVYVSDFTEERIEELGRTFDVEERERIAREIGDYLYDEFASINLGATFEEVVVNPEIIGDWVFPGRAPTSKTHYYMIERAQ